MGVAGVGGFFGCTSILRRSIRIEVGARHAPRLTEASRSSAHKYPRDIAFVCRVPSAAVHGYNRTRSAWKHRKPKNKLSAIDTQSSRSKIIGELHKHRPII